MHSYNQHWFLSARGRHSGHQRIFYKACNHSDGRSAFRWEGAGFGVTAFAQLEQNFCAYKNNYTEATLDPAPETVWFQGGPSGQVMTLVPENSGNALRRAYSYVEAMVKGPEGYVALSEVSVLIELADDGSAIIAIETSGEFDAVVVALPAASLDIDGLRQLVSLDSDAIELEFSTFEELPNTTAEDISILTGNVRGDAVSFRLRHPDGGPIDARVFVQDMRKFGDVLVSFGETSGWISMRNDIYPPKPG
jgi:hypothetical protein